MPAWRWFLSWFLPLALVLTLVLLWWLAPWQRWALESALALPTRDDGERAARQNAVLAAFKELPPSTATVPILRKALQDSDRTIQRAALDQLLALGAGAVGAEPELRLCLTQPGFRAQAAYLLVQIDTAWIDPGIRALAAILQARDREAPVSESEREQAGRYLGELARDHQPARAVLLHALRAESWDRQVPVVSGLVLAGAPLVPELLQILRTGKDEAIGGAAQVLGKVGANHAEVATELAGVLKNPDRQEVVQQRCLEALKALGAAASPAREAVIAQLRSSSAACRALAADVLVGLGETSTAPLLELLRDPSETQRALGSQALARLGPRAAQAVPELVRLLDSPEPGRQGQALEVLGTVGPAATEAIPAVWKLAQSRSPLRRQALLVLGRLGPSAIPVFSEALQNPELCADACQALTQLGPAAQAVRPTLLNLLQADRQPADPTVLAALIQAMGALAQPDPPTAVVLGPLLQHRDANVVTATLTALEPMGAAARPAVPGLVVLLRNPSSSHRRWAAQVLEKVGAAAPEATPALQAASEPRQEHDSEVRRAAAAALQAVDRFWVIRYPYWPILVGASIPYVVVLVLGLRRWRRRVRRRRRQQANQELVRDFRERNQPGSALGFLERHPELAPAQQLELILLDQRCQWEQRQPRPVLLYLARWPAVAARRELVLQLLTQERHLAREHGAPVDRELLSEWFPAEFQAELGGHLAEQSVAASPAALTLTAVPREQPVRAAAPVAPAAASSTVTGGAPEQAPVTVDHVPADQEVTIVEQPGSAPGLPCARISRYTLEGVLGSGSFGAVYLARDEELRRPVAVKVPLRSRGTGPGVLVSRHTRAVSDQDIDAYLAEARIVASLDHPHIVPVYDAGRTEDGLCYVVSKLIGGTNLTRHTRDLLPPSRVATLMLQAAEALHHAHTRGLVHRDIKPANLLLDEQGTLYVADFGLALTPEEFFGQGEGEELAGTPAYMSPEQTRGATSRLDGRSDLFSLGVVFYELLTGQRPFRGDTLRDLLWHIQEQRPTPPQFLRFGLQASLGKICQKCLAKSPVDRFASAQALADELRRWLTSHAAPDRSGSGQGRLAERIVPDRLQPFTAEDADFFLELLPEGHDPQRLPDVLQRLKERVETGPPVVLLTGPPGCGASSLVQAGLLPRLRSGLVPILVVARGPNLMEEFRQALHERFPELPREGDVRTLLNRVQEDYLGPGQRLLLVLDSFHRWLTPAARADLHQLGILLPGTLRWLLVLHANFLKPALDWLHSQEPHPVEGAVVGVEPFEPKHALSVLVRMGQVWGTLPREPTAEQLQALQAGLLAGGAGEHFLPVRLAQLARVLGRLPWAPARLHRPSGTQPIALTDLKLRAVAREGNTDPLSVVGPGWQVLEALLPEKDESPPPTWSRLELLERLHIPGELDEVLRLLEEEFRLIALTPEGEYQLANPEMVPALRRWLKRRDLGSRGYRWWEALPVPLTNLAVPLVAVVLGLAGWGVRSLYGIDNESAVTMSWILWSLALLSLVVWWAQWSREG